MKSKRFSPIDWLTRFASRLRFPVLFTLTALVFIADVFVPDVIPFADEIILGLVTTLLGSLRKKKVEKK